MSAQNLRNEGKSDNRIFVTGNTAIDALKTTVKENYSHPMLEKLGNDCLILLAAHRRENLGEPMRNIFRAINRHLEEHKDIQVIYPLHMNPAVREVADEILGNNEQLLFPHGSASV